MATARRIIYSSYVVPQESLTLENGETRYSIESGCGKTFGGKGTINTTAAQWGEGWTSMGGTQQHWEDMATEHWEAYGGEWDGTQTISGVTSLVLDAAGVTTTMVKFLYIRNLGTASNQKLKVSLDDGSNYKILIPPLGSIALRGDGSTLETQDVKVNKVDADTTIEFIVAI